MSQDPFLAPEALARLGRYILLDVRAPDAFEAGHPAGAVRVPIETWEAAARTRETSFDHVAYWERAIGDLGVDGTVPAVLYDDGRLTEAARVWFILQYLGAAAFIVDGGWPAIQGQAAPLAAAAQSPERPATFRARPGSGAVGLVDRQTLKAEIDGEARIFDARTAAEFAGDDLRRNARGGHLPGARLVPHASLLDGGHIKPSAALHRLLTEAGFQPGDHVVTHCDGGGRAALAAAAAVRAGYGDVRVYYLSFADWAKDESCPIVRD
jgi:thiosulfate/3-mercaptopyruvate sulfurtransferase